MSMNMRSLAAAALLCLGAGLATPAQAQTVVNPGCNTFVSLYPASSRGQAYSIDQRGAVCINGSITASLSGFTPAGTFATLTATNASASVALPAGAVVIFQNTGTTAVSCTLGVGSATATVSQNIVQPASWLALTVGSNNVGACIDVTGSTSNLVVLSGGAGLPTGAGGGGGSGGGGAVTNAGTFAVQLTGATNNINNIAGTISLPTGAATSANQTSELTKLDTIITNTGAVIPSQAPTVSIGGVGIKDAAGTNTAAVKAASTAPAATDPAFVVTLGQNAGLGASATPMRTDPTGTTTQPVRTTAGATGGATLSSAIAPATPAGVSLKASAGTVFRLPSTTIQSTPVYIKFYDTASVPTCGSGTPKARFMIPVASTAANGAGNNVDLGDIGVAFTTGIGYCVTGALPDADTTAITANNTLVNIVWN